MTAGPSLRRYVLPWGGMLLLIGVELLSMVVGLPQATPLIALAMAAVIITGPMQIGAAPRLAWIFALAGVFWLVFMLFGLGTLDPLTRHHAPDPTIANASE